MAGEMAGLDLLLGAGQMGVGMYAGRALKKANKQLTALDDTMRNRSHAGIQRDLGRAQSDVNREAFDAKQNNLGNAAERGITHSSIPVAREGRIEDDRARRYTALQDRRNDLSYQWADEATKRVIQKQSARLQANLKMIDSALQGGASGAASYYAGGNV